MRRINGDVSKLLEKHWKIFQKQNFISDKVSLMQ